MTTLVNHTRQANENLCSTLQELEKELAQSHKLMADIERLTREHQRLMEQILADRAVCPLPRVITGTPV